MDREEALRLITLGILAAHAAPRSQARQYAEHLLAEYLRDPGYRVVEVEVPEEFVDNIVSSL